ncbi:MAG: transcriptional regulator [Phycisphaerales bacterium]|jgi:DNA-binding MarR family transcriptional regulator|nr:transcriptional regulator [Phycisphaerales bacterium]
MDRPSYEPAPSLQNLCSGHMGDESLQAWRQMFHTFLKQQRKIEEMLAPYDLALSQFEGLAKIAWQPGVIQQDLVHHLLVTKGNVGALVDRLESAGLVERRADPNDRRANRLFLTKAGESLLVELFEKHRTMVREMFRPLSPAQHRTLSSLLKMIEPPAE